jgi:malate dehydrogenase (quinone)
MATSWKPKVAAMVPSYGQKLNASPDLTNRIRRMTSQTLGLPYVEVPASLNGATPDAGAKLPPKRNLNSEQQAL